MSFSFAIKLKSNAYDTASRYAGENTRKWVIHMKLLKPGDVVRTPRFLNVQIKEIFDSADMARAAGYTEPTHFVDETYEILGRSLDMYHMVFAAAFRPGAAPDAQACTAAASHAGTHS